MFERGLNEKDVARLSEIITSSILREIVDVNAEALQQVLQNSDTLDKLLTLERDTIRSIASQCDKIVAALTFLNNKLEVINETLDLHLQVATVRAGLETSDQGVYDSLVLGLRHMRSKCKDPYNSRESKREFEAIARKIDTLLREFDILANKAQIDELISNIKAITSVPSSKRERKRREPG